jgi:hypothetical protein
MDDPGMVAGLSNTRVTELKIIFEEEKMKKGKRTDEKTERPFRRCTGV